MRNGTLIVDGVNLWTTYHAFISRGGYKGVAEWPALKAVTGNDWQEENGFEPDLSSIHLDKREFDVDFACTGSLKDVTDLYSFLLSTPKKSYVFSDISLTKTLRVVSMASFDYSLGVKKLSVRFAEDTPLEGYTYAAPSSDAPGRTEFVIDDVPFSDYGVRILRGTITKAAAQPPVKPLLVSENSVTDGATYDKGAIINDVGNSLGEGYETIGNAIDNVSGNWKRSTAAGTVTTASRDISLNCLLIADSFAEAWQNYDALLYNLVKIDDNADDVTLKGARRIKIRPLAKAYLCYYKNQSVTDFSFFGSEVWIKFNLNLTLFAEDGDLVYLLASEDDKYIITEDGKYIEIELKY